MFCNEKIKKGKLKIKTQNGKTVETDMDIWYYTQKTNINVRKKQCNVSSRKSKSRNLLLEAQNVLGL